MSDDQTLSLLGVSSVISSYIEWLCGPNFEKDTFLIREAVEQGSVRPPQIFSPAARRNRLADRVTPQSLVGTGDDGLDPTRIAVVIQHGRLLIEPYLPEVLKFVENYSGYTGHPSGPRSDADVIREAWASWVAPYDYQFDPSPGLSCIGVAKRVIHYKKVRKDRFQVKGLEAQASRMSSLVCAIGNAVAAAEQQSIRNATLAVSYVRMADPENEATSFSHWADVLEEMLTVQPGRHRRR